MLERVLPLAICAAAVATAPFFMVAAATQGTPITTTTPRFGGNPEAAKIANPVPPSPESIALGRRSFQLLCVRCHGPEGKGDGGGAGAGGQPADLTDDVWDFGGSDGEIFTVLRDGTSADMESYAERLNETALWHLVNYIRSIGPHRSARIQAAPDVGLQAGVRSPWSPVRSTMNLRRR